MTSLMKALRDERGSALNYGVCVSNNIIPELFFGSGSAWSISAVGGVWRTCTPGNPATSSIFPATATGVCGYN
jgi:hypothetical protein